MALLDIHTVKDIPIHVYASTSDTGYGAIDKTIVIALNFQRNFYCMNLYCDTSCPFWDSYDKIGCITIATNFLQEHYLSQYPEYFI